jgi:hypothetical protein
MAGMLSAERARAQSYSDWTVRQMFSGPRAARPGAPAAGVVALPDRQRPEIEVRGVGDVRRGGRRVARTSDGRDDLADGVLGADDDRPRGVRLHARRDDREGAGRVRRPRAHREARGVARLDAVAREGEVLLGRAADPRRRDHVAVVEDSARERDPQHVEAVVVRRPARVRARVVGPVGRVLVAAVHGLDAERVAGARVRGRARPSAAVGVREDDAVRRLVELDLVRERTGAVGPRRAVVVGAFPRDHEAAVRRAAGNPRLDRAGLGRRVGGADEVVVPIGADRAVHVSQRLRVRHRERKAGVQPLVRELAEREEAVRAGDAARVVLPEVRERERQGQGRDAVVVLVVHAREGRRQRHRRRARGRRLVLAADDVRVDRVVGRLLGPGRLCAREGDDRSDRREKLPHRRSPITRATGRGAAGRFASACELLDSIVGRRRAGRPSSSDRNEAGAPRGRRAGERVSSDAA